MKSYKFSAITLYQASSKLTEPIQVADFVWIYPTSPFQDDGFWSEWLGSLRFKELTEANATLLAQVQTSNSDLDIENQEAQRKVLTFWYSFLLLGIPTYSRINYFTGSASEKGTRIQQVSRLPVFRKIPSLPSLQISEVLCNNLKTIFERLQNIYGRKGAFKRLRSGFKIFTQAICEEVPYDRVHQFVRSVEALIMAEPGRTKSLFQHRCQTFCKASDAAKSALERLYDFRSRVEHLQDWDDLFPGHEKEHQLPAHIELARQAETLARHTYFAILMNADLLEWFENDERLGEFWKLSDDERVSFLPFRINLP